MVVYNVSEVVSWDTVTFQKYEIHVVARHSVLNGYMFVSLSALETEHPFLACLDILTYLLKSETAALFSVFSVNSGIFLIGGLLFADSVYFLGSEKTRVSESALNELLCENVVYLLALSLAVGAVFSVISVSSCTFVECDSEVSHCVDESLDRALNFTFAVGILDTEHKGSVIVFCDQIRIQGSTQVSYMHPACRARCKSCFYIAHFSFLLISGLSGTILLSVPFHHLFRMENSPAFLPSCTILPLLPAAMLFFRPLRRAVSNIP